MVLGHFGSIQRVKLWYRIHCVWRSDVFRPFWFWVAWDGAVSFGFFLAFIVYGAYKHTSWIPLLLRILVPGDFKEFRTFCFFSFPFVHPFRGRDTPKKRKNSRRKPPAVIWLGDVGLTYSNRYTTHEPLLKPSGCRTRQPGRTWLLGPEACPGTNQKDPFSSR